MVNVWLPLGIAFLGNAVAILVVILTNNAATKREESRQGREDERLEHQRHDQRMVWEREDRSRVSDMQREYYLDFFLELRKASLAVHNAGYEIGPQLGSEWNLPAFESLERLRVFASPEAFAPAHEAYAALWRWGDSGEGGYETEDEMDYNERLAEFLKAVRTDLGVAKLHGS